MALRDNQTNVRITATDETAGALASVRAGIGGLGDAAESSIGRMGALFAGGAVIGGLALLGNEVRKAISDFDNMGKEAQRLGIGIENLSRLTYAAKLSDIGSAELSTGIAQLSRVLAETPDKVEALGVATRDAEGNLRSADTILADLADQFAATRDGTEKTAAAMELFGRSGKELIPLLNAGSEGLREMGDEADRFGITITPEAAANAEEFNDNLTRLATAASGLGYTIAKDLVKPMAEFTELLVKAISTPAEMEDPTSNWFTTWFNEASNSVDRARVALFEFIGAEKLAAKARDDLAKGQGRSDALATNTLIAAAQEGETQFAADTAGEKDKGVLPSPDRGTGRKAKAPKAAKEPAFFSGVDLTNDAADFEMEAFRADWDARIALEAEKQAELEEQHRQHRERILADYLASSDATLRIAAAQIQWEKMTATEKTSFMLGEAQSLTAGLATVSKAAFNVNKAAAIGQTVMATYESAQQAFKAYAGIPIVGPVLGAVAAASAIAMGLQRVKAIKSTQFGGGAGNAAGVGGIPSLSGGIASAQQAATQPLLTADPPIARAQAASPQRNVTIILESDSGQVSTEWVASTLMPKINELVGSGYQLNARAA